MSVVLNKEQRGLLKDMVINAERMGLNASNTDKLTNLYRSYWTFKSQEDINFLNLVRDLYIHNVLKKQ